MSEKRLRDVLFAPWRLNYIKKGKNVSLNCVFCEAVKNSKSPEALILFSGKSCSIILNKFPYNNGHLMIIPHDHLQDLSQLDEESFSEIHQLLKRAQEVLVKEYKPGGFNIGMNVGRTGGAGIAEHMHYHIVPRWDGDTNFMPILGGTKVVSESVEQTYSRLKPYFENISHTQDAPPIRLDHLGVAVKSHSEAYAFWKILGWHEDEKPEVVADQKVKVAMLPLQNSARVELLEPTSNESVVTKYISKHGPGVHHVCFRVKNIESYLAKLKSKGVKLINESPVAGAHGCRVAFIHPISTGGILVELSEKAEE